MHDGKFQKNSKKTKNIKKIPLWLHFNTKLVGKGWETEKIKIIVLFRSDPMRNRKFHKNNKKIKKYHYRFIYSQNRLENDEKRANKNYHSVPFLPDA